MRTLIAAIALLATTSAWAGIDDKWANTTGTMSAETVIDGDHGAPWWLFTIKGKELWCQMTPEDPETHELQCEDGKLHEVIEYHEDLLVDGIVLRPVEVILPETAPIPTPRPLTNVRVIPLIEAEPRPAQ